MRNVVPGLLVWSLAVAGIGAAAGQAAAEEAQMAPPGRAAASRPAPARDARKKALADPTTALGNPNHPLKDSSTDPGPNPDKEAPDDRYADGSPVITHAEGNWPWGELLYGKTYPTSLTIKNDCWSDETVGIFVTNLPYISLPASVTVPARSSLDVPITIVTPPPPNLILTGRETIPEHGIFGDVQGEVVVWHPWTAEPECKPNRESYKASGHIHYDLTPPPPPPSPEKIAGAGPCHVWWNTGQRPATVKEDQDCSMEIRELAAAYRLRVLQPVVDRAPAQWAWLPSAEQIGQMSIGECLAMKSKAQAQMEKQR